MSAPGMKLIPMREEIAERMSERLAVLGSTVECIKETLFGTLSDKAKLAELSAEALIGVVHEIRAIHEDLGAGSWDESTAPATGAFTDDDAERTPLPALPPALACPFCGNHDDIMITKVSAEQDNREEWFRATCGNCGVDAPGGNSLAQAAEVWNIRGNLPVPTDEEPQT